MSVGDGPFSLYPNNIQPGPTALGQEAKGLGYGGITNSAAVAFQYDEPGLSRSQTGVFYNGVYPHINPIAPNVSVSVGAASASPPAPRPSRSNYSTRTRSRWTMMAPH